MFKSWVCDIHQWISPLMEFRAKCDIGDGAWLEEMALGMWPGKVYLCVLWLGLAIPEKPPVVTGRVFPEVAGSRVCD